MEWEKGDKYFFKLEDGSILTGEIIEVDTTFKYPMIFINDKYDNMVSFREEKIIKFEKLSTNKKAVTTGCNNCNNTV